MLKAAVIGAGRMGRGHIGVYQQLEKDGYPVRLAAICDVDEPKLFGNKAVEFNLAKDTGVGANAPDYSAYQRYTDYRELLAREKPDVVSVVVPTYLHAQVSVAAMRAGAHALSEKPMARTLEECQSMLDASRETGKRLFIGQCLHFWEEYEILKDYVDRDEFGAVLSGYFYRGGAQDTVNNPSWRQWIIQRDKGGGGLFDQHIHDIDVIRWCFGSPTAVSTLGKTVLPDSAYDVCSTQYYYPGGAVVNAQDDTCHKGAYGFRYGYKVNFEKGTMLFEEGQLTIYPAEGEKILAPRNTVSAYYKETRYFLDGIQSGEPFTRCMPEEAMENVRIALAEMASADRNGAIVTL